MEKEDEQFAAAADEALFDGTALVSDMAESQLLAQIRDNNLGAIMYWLKHRNPNYNNRLEVTAKLKHEDDKLTPEQEAAITEALKLASLATDEGASTTPSSNSSNATTEENITENEMRSQMLKDRKYRREVVRQSHYWFFHFISGTTSNIARRSSSVKCSR